MPNDYEAMLVEIEGKLVDITCYDALAEMLAACRKAGYSCMINSAYRDIVSQQQIWDERVQQHIKAGYSKKRAEEIVGLSVAIPGTSEHHLGLAVDLGGSYSMYSWLGKNSWKYGFIVRYPTGKTAITGITYEPWHFRYLGEELAKEVYDSKLTLEEYFANIG